MEGENNLSLKTSPLPFLHMVERLKNIPRAGWVKRGIKSPESVSDHMYRMAIMCWILKSDEEDLMKCVGMALVHDMGESIIRDITPSDGISKEEKHLRERLAMKYIACLAKPANPAFAEKIMDFWLEFEEGITKEAQLVREVDAFECLVQAKEYEQRSRGEKDLGDFLELEARISSPELLQWTRLLSQEREAFLSKKSTASLVIFVLRGPGVGKGTQCARLAREFNFQHISVGDLLREEAKCSTSMYADFINDSMQNSITIPAPLTISLLESKINEVTAEGKTRFLIDGFPRSTDQALEFEEKIHEHNFTLFLECREDVLLQCLRRRAESSDRIDDNLDVIMKRLQTFQNDNLPVEQHLRRNGHFKTIICNDSVDKVYASIKLVVHEIIHQGEMNE